MKLTTRGHYSVKALLDLSLQPSGSRSSVREIASRQQLPAPYLEKLLIELRRADIVRSVRGAHGGYYLSKPPGQISLAQILDAVGESVHSLAQSIATDTSQPNKISKTEASPAETSPAEDWVTTVLWQRLSHKLREALSSITLEDLYYDARSWQAAQGEDASFVV
ncbi:MAG: Rrf2 family transcriptional regulator [Cyanobacteria bacterium J06560_2]